MSVPKKAWKLQEYVAHSPGKVTCLSFGRRSGRVMATGGEDCKVNLWAVGKPSCIMSLTGHNNPITSVEFNPEEEKVVAGSSSGAVRVWDLEEVKMVRALSGHTAAVSSIDFHPFGNFVATGSKDKSIKLWDIARKGCIHTYRGHTDAINMLRFSPDGKWMVSAGEDGSIKIWDLSSGKQLCELPTAVGGLSNPSGCQNGSSSPVGPITSVAFHPTVLLLASGSVDRVVRLYDLETFQMIGTSADSTGPDCPGPVRRISFHPEGHCLYAATNDLLKVYSVEPCECMETVSVGWNRHSSAYDMAVAASFNQLIGASIQQSLVSTYVADIKSCAPFVLPPPQVSSQLQTGAESRAVAERPFTQSGSHRDAANPRRSFICSAEETKRNPPKEEPSSSEGGAEEASTPGVMETYSVIKDPDTYMKVFKPKHTIPRSPKAEQRSPLDKDDGEDQPFQPPKEEPQANSSRHTSKKASGGTPLSPKAIAPPTHSVPPSEGKVDVDDFMPKGNQVEGPGGGHFIAAGPALTPQPMSDIEALNRLREPHEALMLVMADRSKKLTTVRMLWSRDNLRTAVDAAIYMKDKPIMVDLLSVLVQNPAFWSLDLATLLLPHLSEIMAGKYDAYLEVACQAVKIILNNFSQLIRQTLIAPPPVGVDLMREERRQKCKVCFDYIVNIRQTMGKQNVLQRAGPIAKEVDVLMQMMEL